MGFFANIIADSRVSVRAAAPATVATADLPGLQPLSWPVDNRRPLQNDKPLVPPIAEALTPNLSAVPAPARPATVASETPAAPTGEAVAPVTTTISQPAPEASRAKATDETGTNNPTTAAQTPANQPIPLHQQTSIPAASPAAQRQISTPGIAGATPPLSHTSAPPDRQAMVGSAPVIQRLPHGETITMGDTVRPRQEVQARGSQAVTPQSSAMSDVITSKVVEGEPAAGTTSTTTVPSIPLTPPAQPRREAQAHAVLVAAPSMPPPSAQTPQNESQRAVPRTPQVRIGQVNVIVEAPAAPRPQPQVTQTGPLSSRLFLRSL
jgi:hypothetical protein